MDFIEQKSKLGQPVELEEKDWIDARDQSKKMIREAKLQLEMATISLKKSNEELIKIWEKLPKNERNKRYADL